jgi:hypothetical protein
MAKNYLELQKSEGIVVQAAAQIYAGYLAAGRVAEGQETEYIKRSIRDAIQIAVITDSAVISDEEIDDKLGN